MITCTVVPNDQSISDAEYQAALLTGLARCERAVGARSLAAAMDLSTRQLSNVQTRGAMPGPKAQWDATRACPSALDDIAALYGFDIVPRGEVVEAPGTLPLATLLQKIAAAEAPDSDGGCAKTHRELLEMEADIRRVNALTGAWLDAIRDIRRPREVRA